MFPTQFPFRSSDGKRRNEEASICKVSDVEILLLLLVPSGIESLEWTEDTRLSPSGKKKVKASMTRGDTMHAKMHMQRSMSSLTVFAFCYSLPAPRHLFSPQAPISSSFFLLFRSSLLVFSIIPVGVWWDADSVRKGGSDECSKRTESLAGNEKRSQDNRQAEVVSQRTERQAGKIDLCSKMGREM